MAREMIGREEELGSIDAFLDRLEDGPAALVLAGEPGIGKTILWEAGVARAGKRACRVLSCRGVEAEASFAFAGLSELVAGVLDEAAPALASPRRRALEVALLLAEPGEAAPEALAIGLAFLDVLRVLADPGPVLVAVDDLQWLDVSSAAVLQVALKRLRDERVGLLATVREPDDARPPELERLLPEERLERLRLAPLSLGALHHLLRGRLGTDLPRPELTRLHQAAGGNPFFALELGRELVRADTGRGARQSLRVPRSLQELLGGRLARLPAETRDVLVYASALARPTVELLTAACGEAALVGEALDDAVHASVVELDGPGLRFAHPLLASISYEQAPPSRRADVHRALADAVTDPEERARHLALATGGRDAELAAELEAAAEQAAARGAPAAAAELAELGAERTPGDPSTTRRRWSQAAAYHHRSGDVERAGAILDRLLEQAPPGPGRAETLLALVSIWRADVPGQMALCDEALAEAGDDDALCARILAFRAWIHLLTPDAHAALADTRAALERAQRVGDPVLLATVISRVGQAEMWRAEVTPGLLERGAEIERSSGLAFDYRSSPTVYLARMHMRMGRLDDARGLLEGLEGVSAARGDEGTRLVTHWYVAMLEWTAGRWQRALAHASEAYDPGPGWTGWPGRVTALIQADLGLVEEARATAEVARAYSARYGNRHFVTLIDGVLGRLELSLGNLQSAADGLRDLPERLRATGFDDPTQPVWADTIEALLAVGELERAGSYLEVLEANARRLGSPLALEAVYRCRGLLAAAQGDPAGGIGEVERALSEQPGAAWPFERARTLLALGTVRRQAQQKRPAREALEQALATFEALPAPLWAEKARAELRRISGRRTSDDGLTESERRVAQLAAAGRTNKQIAAELYMGVSTVEMHLSRVYRKLGIRSRSALGSQLAKRVDEAAQA
jgi:DNA-binding CsgD family transcriptional regulator